MGIGASAGGLEALGEFFAHVPVDTGMAFVVVQHLDPTQKGMMPELLQRLTPLKVFQIADRMRVLPNRVYVIPPNRDLSILHGVLHLLTPTAPRGLRLPIDFFFGSLARDRRDRAVGVILSGMGCDGVLGLRAIKEVAGLTLVQQPKTAKFDAMPHSAIAAGVADLVAPAGELPARLIAYLRNRPRLGITPPLSDDITQGSLEKIVILLRAHCGHDFTLYRRSTLDRRIEHRMGIHQIARVDHYVRYLQENPQELGILFKELLIGVTGFFRDPLAWQQLAKRALPALLAKRTVGGTLRAWVAGCSTGEEAYSLAMVFTELAPKLKSSVGHRLQIYATDLDKDAIDKARVGFFPETIATVVSPVRLARFFLKEPGGYRIKKEIRAMVVFAPQNLIMDPPFTKLDILCCRNLLIYLNGELQKKLLPLFHYTLNPHGLLFLGSSESLGSYTRLFTPLALKERIFQRNESVRPESLHDFPAVFNAMSSSSSTMVPPAPRVTPSLQSLADQLLQTRFAPPAVLVNEQGDILYISGRTGRYLEPAAGKANWNVIAMARDGLRYELSRALQSVQRKKTAVVKTHGIKIGSGAETWGVDLMVQLLDEPKELAGMVLIVFTETAVADSSKQPASRGRSARQPAPRELERALQLARDEVQACREEMQTSQEELRSLNEELQSANEELQSTNEELTTSKEEMQSLNEELQTVNAELVAKLDELSGANNDMKNLLNSTDIATVFLDNELGVRRFTSQAKSIIKFIQSDIGRPVTDLASDLLYPALVADAQEVLRTLVFVERAISTNDGRWFTVRIMPYRTMDNRIDGVVITFSDITTAKKLEAELRASHSLLAGQAAEQGRALDRALGKLEGQTMGRAPRPSKRLRLTKKDRRT